MNSIIIELPNIDISSLIEVISTIKHLDVEYKITEKSNLIQEREKEIFSRKLGCRTSLLGISEAMIFNE